MSAWVKPVASRFSPSSMSCWMMSGQLAVVPFAVQLVQGDAQRLAWASGISTTTAFVSVSPGGQQDGKPLVSSDQAVVPDVHDERQDQAVFLNARVQGFILLVLGRELHPGVIGGRFDVGQLDYSGFHASTPFRFGQKKRGALASRLVADIQLSE